VSATETYDTYRGVFTTSSESVSATFTSVRFNISRQFLHEPATRFVIAGGGVKLDKWDIGGQIWRDLKLDETTQQEYMAQYASQCWGLGLKFVKKPGETQYLFTLDLKGLGALKF
jgi:hypothetical protein